MSRAYKWDSHALLTVPWALARDVSETSLCTGQSWTSLLGAGESGGMIQAALDRITLLPAPRLFWARIAQPITKSTERADQCAARTWSTLVSGGTHTTHVKGVGKGKPLAFLLPCKQGFAESWLRAVRGKQAALRPPQWQSPGLGRTIYIRKEETSKAHNNRERLLVLAKEWEQLDYKSCLDPYLTFISYFGLIYLIVYDEEKPTDLFSVYKRTKSHLKSSLLTTNMG